MISVEQARLGIIGLGYVGLPLAVEFGKRFPTCGFDVDARRIADLMAGHDDTLEVTREELAQATRLVFSGRIDDLTRCNVYIVTVPTPLDRSKRPDLSLLEAACRTLGVLLEPGNVAIFESTVYPGATEEVCVPLLEQHSGLSWRTDFHVGYSPERINPGDKEHRFTTILKVTSGSTPEAATFIDRVYAQVVAAGTHKASSIKVAEAAKVIENTQRDVNIALINELAGQVDMQTVDGRARLAELARPLVAKIPQGVYRELLIDSLAEEVGLTSAKLEKMLGNAAPTSAGVAAARGQRRAAERPGAKGQPSVVRHAISLVLNYPDAARKAAVEKLAGMSRKGADLLQALIETVQAEPNITTAGLLERFRHDEQGRHLGKLAMTGLPDDEEFDPAAELAECLDQLAQAGHVFGIHHHATRRVGPPPARS